MATASPAAPPPQPPHLATDALPTYTDSHPSPSPLPPSPHNACTASALARFEYEAGHTSVATGTKVLLIEWEDGVEARGKGTWTVEWKGRSLSLPADDVGATPADADASFSGAADSSADGAQKQQRARSPSSPPDHHRNAAHRLYFILPAGTPVPPSVAISFHPAVAAVATSQTVLCTTIPTLPAIFPPSLLTTGTAQGKKGVLHTLWAKSRLHALRADMAAGSPTAHDARVEFDGICENFGIDEAYGTADVSSQSASAPPASASASTATATDPQSPYPATPISPTSNERFLSKMKGLRVGTADPSSSSAAPPDAAAASLLSPEAGDVAVGSFAALKGPALTTSAPAPPQQPQPPPLRTAVPIAPPADLAAAQRASGGGFASLAGGAPAALATGLPPTGMSATGTESARVERSNAADEEDEDEDEEGLFALPISPRSPDMAKGVFSWDAREAGPGGRAVVGR